MSRPRTATNLLDARGAFDKDPQRERVDPKVSAPFPTEAPSHLSPLELKWWHKISAAVPDGILRGSDVFAVELAAVLWAEFVTDRNMAAGRIAQMRGALGVLGLSPADRARLATKPEGDDGDF